MTKKRKNIPKTTKNFYIKDTTIQEIRRLSYELDVPNSLILSVLVENPPPKPILKKLVEKEKKLYGYI